MAVFFRSAYNAFLLGLFTFMLGSPALDGLRPDIADPYLTAFHTNTLDGLRSHGVGAPSTVELAKAASAMEDAIVVFAVYLNK